MSSNSTPTGPVCPFPGPPECHQPQSRARLSWQRGKCSGTVTQGHVGLPLVPQPGEPQLCPLLMSGKETFTQICYFFFAHCREKNSQKHPKKPLKIKNTPKQIPANQNHTHTKPPKNQKMPPKKPKKPKSNQQKPTKNNQTSTMKGVQGYDP